jgi:transcriptional regulator with XRE-family HTH domain
MPLTIKQQLPDRLLEARKKKGISQQDLAKLAKVHFTNVGKYERGDAAPAADVLNRIAKALDVTTDYLLNGTMQDKSADAISDEELLSQFRKIKNSQQIKRSSLKSFLMHYFQSRSAKTTGFLIDKRPGVGPLSIRYYFLQADTCGIPVSNLPH